MAKDYRHTARYFAKKHGLDPDTFERQIRQESGFNPRAKSPAGARGIAQIMPGTAKAWKVNPDDPRASLDVAAKNMAAYVRKYGSYKNALVAYNAGPGRVGGKLPAETQHYIKTILGNGNGQTSAKGERRKPAKQSSNATGGANRDALLKEYLARRGDPSALRNLAVGIKDSDTAEPPKKSSKPSGGSGGGKNPWKAALAAGGSVSSGKRPGAITSSGNVSDHSESAPGQMARDFVGKDMNKIAHEIARALGIKDYKPGSIVNVKKGGKKYQLIYGTSDHKDHVHLGRKRA